jgi:hypothetical protein
MRRLLAYPLVLLLSIKCGCLGVLLKVAREQTGDAAAIGCPGCIHSAQGCANGPRCPIQRFKAREATLLAEILSIQKRVARLDGRAH